MAGAKKTMRIGVMPSEANSIFKIQGPFHMILENTDRPGVKRLKQVIKERPETISEFHEFIRFLAGQVRKAADLLYEVGDARHRQRAESIRNHALQELQIADRSEKDPDRLRASMLRLQQTLKDLKQVATEEEVQGH